MSLMKKLEQLNGLINSISLLEDNRDRLKDTLYLDLLTKADNLANEISKMKVYKKLELK